MPAPRTRRRSVKASHDEFAVLIERDEEGWYIGTVPALPGCYTQAKSIDKLLDRVREAIKLCLPDGE